MWISLCDLCVNLFSSTSMSNLLTEVKEKGDTVMKMSKHLYSFILSQEVVVVGGDD